MLKSFEVHNSCLKPQKPGTKILINCWWKSSPCIVSYTDFIALDTGRNVGNKVWLCERLNRSIIGKRHS